MARKTSPQTPLYDVMEKALKKWSDAGWLGENSLLASPYLLGSSLQADEMIDPVMRGCVLKKLMKECVDVLDPFDQEILRKTFFSGRKKLKGIWDEIPMSKPVYYRARETAIKALEKVLIERLEPALRLEHPVKVTKLVGREADVDNCLNALRQNQSIALIGTGGVGKTTLGSYIAHKFAPDATFWFTFYLGFNDQMDSLLFNLGYFFHSQGVSALWSQILAQHQKSKPFDLAIMQGLIRHDLEQLQRPLLCFDEVDLLKIGEEESHSQIRSLIEALRGHTPILLMGQQNRIEIDLSITLDRLGQDDLQKWFEQLGIDCKSNQLKTLHHHAQGNPRLLQLIITLYQMGESFEGIITRLPNEPSVEFLLNRIWQRLEGEEKKLLLSLSVFRRPVPREMEWGQPNAQGIWERLIDRQLVRYDGGLSLVPAYGAVLYRLLSLEEREFMHNQAALIRAILTDYTASAYHYIEANQAEKAILQWHQYRQEEINRGQAEVARELFKNVSTAHLSQTAQEALKCINAKLALISGRLEEAKKSLGNLNNTVWKTPLLKQEALKLTGYLANLQNEFGVAMHAYRNSLENAERFWPQQLPILRKEISWVYMMQKNMDSAWHEAQIAYYEIENLRGNIKRQTGDFSQAEKFYQIALEIAEELQHTEGIAKTYNSLSVLYRTQGRLDDAVRMSQKSIDIHQRLGRMVDVAGSMSTLATTHTFRKDFVQAIEIATEALKSFEIFNNPWGIAVTCQTLAESHIALDQLDDAKKRAWQVIDQEEEKVIPDAMRVLGEIELKWGNNAQAEIYIRQSIEHAQENEDPYLEAYGWRALGEVYLAKKDTAQANDSFERAIALFDEMGLENEIEKTRVLQTD